MGSSGSKKKKVEAVGQVSASYKRHHHEDIDHTDSTSTQPKKTEKPAKPKPEPELEIVKRDEPEKRQKRAKPKIEKIEFDPAVEIDFTNTSLENVYVFVMENGREKHCILEVAAEQSLMAKLPKDSEFQIRDIYNSVYFESVADKHKICFIPCAPVTNEHEKTAIRIFNRSETHATVRMIPISSVSRKLNVGVLSEICFVGAKADVFAEPKQYCLIKVMSEKDETKFELMSANSSQHYQINEDFTDIICMVPPYKPYHEASFMGFLLMLPENLLNKKQNEQLYKALKEDFGEIIRLMPRETVGLIRRVALFINEESDPCVNGLCFHRDRSWLGYNNEPFEKYCAVEIRSVAEYLQMRSRDSASGGGGAGCLMHEYAHAFYFFTQDTNGALIQYSYEETLEKGNYMSLSSKSRPHYAITDCEEYFAECTVAFFSSKTVRASKYPQDCLQLRAFDPVGFEMCEKVYNVLGHERQNQFLDETREQYKKQQY